MSKLYVILLLCFALPLMVGCSPDSSEDLKSETPQVTLALNWYPEAEHGGFYAALVHGYYKEAGLDVTIRPGGPGTKVVAEVATGKATFGVANADKILTGCAQEADVVALMAPIQDSPRCIMVHEESGIQRLADLKDITLAMSAGQPFARFVAQETNLPGVQVVPFNGGVSTFLRGPKFAQQAYSFSEPFTARQQNTRPRCLMVSEIGFNPYTSVLLTAGEVADASPQLVEKFVAASVRGWEKYLAEPAKTNNYIHSINPEMSMEVLDFGVEALRPLCETKGAPVGSMTSERWKLLESQLVAVGVLKPDEVDVDKVMRTTGSPRK